jgi:hypothetical protein
MNHQSIGMNRLKRKCMRKDYSQQRSINTNIPIREVSMIEMIIRISSLIISIKEIINTKVNLMYPKMEPISLRQNFRTCWKRQGENLIISRMEKNHQCLMIKWLGSMIIPPIRDKVLVKWLKLNTCKISEIKQWLLRLTHWAIIKVQDPLVKCKCQRIIISNLTLMSHILSSILLWCMVSRIIHTSNLSMATSCILINKIINLNLWLPSSTLHLCNTSNLIRSTPTWASLVYPLNHCYSSLTPTLCIISRL